MKQILMIIFLATLVVLGFAAEPRCFWWEVRLDEGDLRDYVDSQDMDVSSTGWLVEAVSSGEPGFVLSTATHHNYLIKIVDGGPGLFNRCWVYVDKQRWTENWAIGDTLTVTVTWQLWPLLMFTVTKLVPTSVQSKKFWLNEGK